MQQKCKRQLVIFMRNSRCQPDYPHKRGVANVTAGQGVHEPLPEAAASNSGDLKLR